MQTKTRPFKSWEKLNMNNIERRKLLCSASFHIIAITCVIWSLYVLIDRTAEEGRSNQFDWAFWTKLIVVAIGFTGGVVFMYIQCKMYFQLCNRWHQYNRVIIVESITDEILKTSKKNFLDHSTLSTAGCKAATNHSKVNILNEENALLITTTNPGQPTETVLNLATS